MGQKFVRLRPNSSVAPCPRCGNNTDFKARSSQVREDGCEVWLVCKCGFDPTAKNTCHRMEDVWGSLDNATVFAALSCSWNDPIREAKP